MLLTFLSERRKRRVPYCPPAKKCRIFPTFLFFTPKKGTRTESVKKQQSVSAVFSDDRRIVLHMLIGIMDYGAILKTGRKCLGLAYRFVIISERVLPFRRRPTERFGNLMHKTKMSEKSDILVVGGTNRARTCDPMLVRHMLYQLSYDSI